MNVTLARSPGAARARQLVETLQREFAAALEAVTGNRFAAVAWRRDDGRHGGGVRFEVGDTATIDRGSINVSQVHYDDEPTRALASATALSTIIHPRSPHAPSVHIHISWTELRNGRAYWRMMADLNPAIAVAADTAQFADALAAAAGSLYPAAQLQGDRYFWIPALGRHRGVTHLYLEDYATASPDDDRALAERIGRAATTTYAAILGQALARATPVTDADRDAQLGYHTLYLFQVLTLDRGTTSGLLIHDQNDVGILGSLPSRVDRHRLASWRAAVPAPQGHLVDALVAALPDGDPAAVTTDAKQRLAAALRAHYRNHPEALDLQASGGVAVPTVANHGAATEPKVTLAIMSQASSSTTIAPVVWTAHPARRRPDHVALVIAVIALASWAVLVTLRAPWLALLAAGLLAVAVAPFWLPTHYRIDGDGIEMRRWPRRILRRWADVRRIDVGPRAALVSPLARAQWLDRYRAITVLFDGGDREAIVAALAARGAGAAP